MRSSSSAPGAPSAAPERLRDRRRRELRQQLSDVATEMFLRRGFDAVRVADVAHACGVTEKTVFNHFPTKESLLVDRWDSMIDAIDTLLGDTALPPVQATLRVLDAELEFLFSPVRPAYSGSHLADLRRFMHLLGSTPALVAHQHAALDRLGVSIAAALARRKGATGDADPEDQIAASALTGLWSLFYRTLHRHLPVDDDAQIAEVVRRDLRRAADLLVRGL